MELKGKLIDPQINLEEIDKFSEKARKSQPLVDLQGDKHMQTEQSQSECD